MNLHMTFAVILLQMNFVFIKALHRHQLILQKHYKSAQILICKGSQRQVANPRVHWSTS